MNLKLALEIGIECPPMTSVGVSAKRENSSRACRGLFGVGIRDRGPVEMGHLAGMMGHVAGEQAFLAVG
jgi:hypothetical protein